MRAGHEDYAQWVPVLSRDIHLYHDNLLDRWVISGLNQVVFLNHASYEVLKRCDGRTDFDAICSQLCDSGVFEPADVYDSVLSIIQDFDLNGFIFDRIDERPVA